MISAMVLSVSTYMDGFLYIDTVRYRMSWIDGLMNDVFYARLDFLFFETYIKDVGQGRQFISNHLHIYRVGFFGGEIFSCVEIESRRFP